METQKNKNSVFAGILPSNEPAPPAAPVPREHKPGVSEEQIAALNKKIELMESTIIGQIEKKLSKQVPPPPPPPSPPSALAPAVLSKMTEMDSRLKDFQEKFLLEAAQTRNIGESKGSTRREIEELLKVVREQQKYTELDRQMHDQLEKAWLRVEEMEKRMMEVYSAAAKRPAEPAAPAVSPAEIAAAVMKTIDSSLKERFAPIEAALISAVAKADATPSTVRGIEARVSELTVAVDARLAGYSTEMWKLRSAAFAGKERVEDILAEVKKEVLSSVREVFSEVSGAFLRHINAAASDGRQRMDAIAKLIVNHMEELGARDRDNTLKRDALESHVRSETAKILSEVSSMQNRLEKVLRAHIEESVDRAAAGNALQLEKIKEAYGLSASNAVAISAVAKNIAEIEARAGGLLTGLKAFIRALSPVNLNAVLGVSGAVIRRSLDAAGELVTGLEKETILLARTKNEIEANLKNMAPETGGEVK